MERCRERRVDETGTLQQRECVRRALRNSKMTIGDDMHRHVDRSLVAAATWPWLLKCETIAANWVGASVESFVAMLSTSGRSRSRPPRLGGSRPRVALQLQVVYRAADNDHARSLSSDSDFICLSPRGSRQAGVPVERHRLPLDEPRDGLPPRPVRAGSLGAEIILAGCHPLPMLGDLGGREGEVVEGKLVDRAGKRLTATVITDRRRHRAAGEDHRAHGVVVGKPQPAIDEDRLAAGEAVESDDEMVWAAVGKLRENTGSGNISERAIVQV